MRIGLIRHFPVTEDLPQGWLTSSDLHEWRGRYESAEALIGEFDLGDSAWEVCISSDLPRAAVTAKAVFGGPVEHTALLREPQFAQFGTGKVRLPFMVWKWVFRFSWMTGHASQRACRDEFMRRVVLMADRLSAMNQDVLVVSHAGMMAYLSAELKRRGFTGPSLRIARHAKVYIYEKNLV